MIPTHFTFNRKLRSLTVVFIALLAVAIVGCVHMWAQRNDTPIIIADGSLTIESRGSVGQLQRLRPESRVHPDTGNPSPRW